MIGSCPMCGGEPRGSAFPFEHIWEGVLYRHLKCGHCGGTYIDPMPTEDTLRRIYTWSSYHAHALPAADAQRLSRLLAIVRRHARPSSRLLDFGCGSGTLLMLAQGLCFDCHGVELESSTIERASARTGCPITALDTLERTAAQFDVICMSDVLLHLPDPAATLGRLEALLSPGGRFAIAGPLESNASLVFWTAAIGKHVSRKVRPGVPPPRLPPTMLVRMSARAQRRFFIDRMGYTEDEFDVYETGWPYLHAGPPRAALSSHLKRAIGSASVWLGQAKPLQDVAFGNRFVGIYRPARARPSS